MKRLLAGTYNSELGGFDNGNPARLRRQLATRAAEALAEYLTDVGDYLGVRTPPSVTGAARCLASVTGSAPPCRRTRSPASRSSRWPVRNRDHRPAVATFTLTA